MRMPRWRTIVGGVLLAAFFALYVAHYLIFRDWHHIAIYGLGDAAFLPLEVLIVTLIIHELLESRSKRAMLQKLNMVIGAFFSEVGSDLLARLTALAGSAGTNAAGYRISPDWTDRDFDGAKRRFASASHDIALDADEAEGLRALLVEKRSFLLRLLENPNLLEHETFTDLLWAVFHLTEELEHRETFADLPESDLRHLAGDVERAYALLGVEWLEHARHLRDKYPYLYSLAARTNPLDPAASVVIAV